MSRRWKISGGLFLLLCLCAEPCAWGWVSEEEPNNNSAQANLITCGDTVLCATMSSPLDVDCFRFTPTAHDSLRIATFNCQGSLTNTLLVLLDSRDSVLAINENSGEHEFSLIRWRATTAEELFLWVLMHPSSPDSAYSLALDCPAYVPEEYDLCATPRLIPALPYFDETGSTLGATDQCGISGAADVFYRFENPALSTVAIEVCTNEFDAHVQLLSNCCFDMREDATEGCGNLGASVTVFDLAPGTYEIMVEGCAAGQAGHFSLEVTALMPSCPVPGPLVLGTVGGYPFLDWPELDGPAYYVVWQTYTLAGYWEHLGSTVSTYFTDSTAFTNSRRYYKITAVCPW